MDVLAPPLGLRERKKQQTREALSSLALRLFDERGFDEVTVDDIVSAADVSPRTFYRYFPSKEDLVLGDVGPAIEAMAAALRERPVDEPVIESIRRVVLDLAADYEHDLDDKRQRAALIEATPALRHRWIERQAAIEEALAPVVAARLGIDDHTDVRPRLIAACAVAAIRVASDVWLANGATGSLIDSVDHALSLLTASLGAATPR
jgi:AcrR family transcriptional regulator